MLEEDQGETFPDRKTRKVPGDVSDCLKLRWIWQDKEKHVIRIREGERSLTKCVFTHGFCSALDALLPSTIHQVFIFSVFRSQPHNKCFSNK